MLPTERIEYSAIPERAPLKLPGGALAYGSASRGFKSGGFNPSSTEAGRGFAPEWAWSYETGLKGTWMDGRSRVAVAGFFMDYTNLQVQTPIQCHGYSIFDDGRMVIFREASAEPTRSQ